MKILDDSRIKNFVSDEEVLKWQDKVSEAHRKLHEKTGEGSDFLGWVDLPVNYDKSEFERIKKAAEKIKNDSDVLVVIGIGGAYTAARIAVEALGGKKEIEIYFSGYNLSSKSMNALLKKFEGKDVSLNVISKSGTTTETMLSFRFLRDWMEKKYGEKASERIYATTDSVNGSLKKVADNRGYKVFIIPSDIGDRYSFFGPSGMLPSAVAGINIDELIRGGQEAREKFSNENLTENECYKYAVYRNIFYNQGKVIENLASYEPSLHMLAEWWKQLFGESEGKDKKGIFPSILDFTTDLHSMGQYMQDGNRIMFETVLLIEDDSEKLVITEDAENADGLNYLAGKTMEEVNKVAMESTVEAHTDGGVPNLILRLPKLDAFNFGYLIYFFEKACGMSGYLLGVNPFNQPGVEAYKKIMFKLLGKPEF